MTTYQETTLSIGEHPKQASSSRYHIPALDGIRGVAILLVMALHFSTSAKPVNSWQRGLFGAMHVGWIGVDLFFVLSGFLITGILFDSKNQRHFFRNFYMRRVLRIFPLYFGVLIILFGGGWLFGGFRGSEATEVWDRQGWLWTYCANIPMAVHNDWLFNRGWVHVSHFWSLAVEEHFYLAWPLLVFSFQRRTMIAVCLASLVLAAGIRTAMAVHGGYDIAVYELTPCRVDSLCVGALLALLVRGPTPKQSILRASRVVAGCSLVLLIVLFIKYRRFSREDFGVMTFGFSLLALFFGALLAMVVGAVPSSSISRILSSKVLRTFGKYSYGLYVLHYILPPIYGNWVSIGFLTAHLGSRTAATFAYAAIATATACVTAYLSWHLFEKRFLHLKRFFEYEPGRIPASASPQPTAGLS